MERVNVIQRMDRVHVVERRNFSDTASRRNPKSQAPISKQIPNTKHQKNRLPSPVEGWKFGASLGFGTWALEI
jgi:hypothetical protein